MQAVNDAPSFQMDNPLLELLEDSAPQRLPAFARDISAGRGEQQRVSFEVVAEEGAHLFASAPTLSPDGTLALRLRPDASGRARLAVVLRDDGWGALRNGANASAAQHLEVVVLPVNDRPSFALAASSVEVPHGALTHTLSGFVTRVSPGGGADEDDQALNPKP